MPEQEPITREEKFLNGEVGMTPITREEKILAGEDVETITRREYFLKKYRGGGGGDVTVVPLSVTENGTYSEEGKAYSPVRVTVPAPVLKTKNITENGTYEASADNADGYSSVDVNVPLPQNAYLLKSVTTPTPIASFNDGANLPMPSLKVAIEPQQEGSGDPSPTNIRPISGWDKANINGSGVNVWDEEWEVGYWGNGVKQASSSNIRSTNKIPIVPNTTYYLLIPSNNIFYYTYYDANGELLPQSGYDSQSRFTKSTSGTITIPTGAHYITFNMSSSYGTTYNNDISINYPSTDTDYHAYNGQTYTIDLDGTRYGGELDAVNGVLVVDRAIRLVSDCIWYGSNGGFYTDSMLSSAKHGDGRFDHVISSAYKTENVGSITPLSDGGISVDARGYVQLKDTRYSTAVDFKTNMGATQLVYELATPLIIQLTPTEIKTLLGMNNIWADTGDITDAEYFSKEV